jgi:hypothetical protein
MSSFSIILAHNVFQTLSHACKIAIEVSATDISSTLAENDCKAYTCQVVPATFNVHLGDDTMLGGAR